jgi:hypothetical protein
MAETTKAVNLTETEIKTLISTQAHNLYGDINDINEGMERLNYFHKRLKAFGEETNKPENNLQAAAQAPVSANQGWGSNPNG